MNADAAKEYQKSDKKLNEVYNEILKKYSDDDIFIKLMKKTQKIWIQFRDAQVEMMFPDYTDNPYSYYGSVYPMCISSYMTRLTDQRTKELQEWLEGSIDGNVCSGSVKSKSELKQ